MTIELILASGSATRRSMLERAGVAFTVEKPRVDEDAIKAALLDEGAKPRDVADALAEFKARKISDRHPEALVLGSDQVLEHQGNLLSKPTDREEARAQLMQLRGGPHKLITAAVIHEGGEPKWRVVRENRMFMRRFSDGFLDAYLSRNWPEIGSSVGGYQIEGEGSRLFDRIEGDHFSILGLPLIEVLGYLTRRGAIQE